MAAQAVIYNPLIKKGFQEIADINSIESALNELQNQVSAIQSNITALQTAAQNLQNKKVTKCFNAADLANLADGEIFTWHGATTSDPAELTQGYFYTKSVGQQVLPSGTKYFLYDTNYPTITKNGYVFAPGNYYHLNTITPANGSNFYSYSLYQWNGISRYYFVLPTDVNLQVGDLVWDNQDYTFVTVVSLDDNGKPTLSNGEYISARGKTDGLFVEIIECKNSDGTAFSFIKSNSGRLVVHYTLNDNVFTLIDWFFVYVVTRTTTTPQTIGVDTYTQTNTQPGSSYTLPIAAANVLGGVKVGSGLDIDESGILSVAAGDNLKVPRCFTQAQIDNLSANDIFQWQGDTTSDFVNGYFYKKVVEHNIGELYLHVATNHSISIYNGGSYSLNIGDYYNDSGATPIYNSTIHNAVFSNSSGANCQFIFISNDEQSWSDVAVGDWVLFNNSEQNLGKSNVFQWVNNGLFYIAQLSEITRDGFGDISSFKIGTSSFTWVSRYGRITNYANSIPVNINGVQTNVFYNDDNNAALVFAPMANGQFAPVMIFETMAEVETPIMGYVRTDTQPQPANGSDMIVNFTPDTSAVRANIQSGDTISRMAQVINNNFGNYLINNSFFEFSSYVTESNLYGLFLAGLGILIICGWFRVITTDIAMFSDMLRFKGYTPIAAYPKFMDENSVHSIVLRTGESGRGEWWLFVSRSSMSDLYWEGLPTIVVVSKTS